MEDAQKQSTDAFYEKEPSADRFPANPYRKVYDSTQPAANMPGDKHPTPQTAVYDKYLPLRIAVAVLYVVITVFLVHMLISAEKPSTPDPDASNRNPVIRDVFMFCIYLITAMISYSVPTGLSAVGLLASLNQNKKLDMDKVPVYFIVMTAIPILTLAFLPSIVHGVLSFFV